MAALTAPGWIALLVIALRAVEASCAEFLASACRFGLERHHRQASRRTLSAWPRRRLA